MSEPAIADTSVDIQQDNSGSIELPQETVSTEVVAPTDPVMTEETAAVSETEIQAPAEVYVAPVQETSSPTEVYVAPAQEPSSPTVGPGASTEMQVINTKPTSSAIAEVSKKQFDSNVTVAYKNVNVEIKVPENSGEYMTVITPFVNIAKAVTGNLKMKNFSRVKDMSGVIRPGTLTLVYAPPGHGKSSYLKVLANRLVLNSGKVAINGRTYDEAFQEGCDSRKMSQYVDQVDSHMALLTVQETIDFAHKMSCHEYSSKRVDDTIALLGLTECKDTILGSDFLRGVSGGQRRRVTIGEMLVSDACLLLLDEPTNGLDTATSEDILRGLRQWCRDTNGSIVCTLQQPTPGLYETFDDIILLREGETVYHGPRDDLLSFIDGMGFIAPNDVDTCDYLIDLLSQPRVVLQRQMDEAKKESKKTGKVAPKPSSTITFSDGTSMPRSPTPCITIENMISYFHSSPIWKSMEVTINKTFPESGHVDLSQFPPLMPTEKSKEMYKVGYHMDVLTLFKLVFRRHMSLIFRDQQLIMPRIFNILLMGLIFGSLYYQIKTDAFFLRVACLLIALTQVAFGNMVELPIAVVYNRVVLKQMAAHFYPAWSYVVAAAFTSIPLFLTEVIIFVNLLYWMCDNYADAGCYFAHIAIVLVQSFNMSVWFRLLSAVAKNETSAQSIAGPSTGLFMIFGGFFVSPSNMPDWMVWLYWISPFSWSVRALANIEFLSARYDGIAVTGERLGHYFLRLLDMETGHEWIGYSVIFLVVVSAIFMFLHTLAIDRPYFELSIGTRRTDDEEISDSDLDKEGDGAAQLVLLSAEEGGDAVDEETAQGVVREESSASLVRDASSFNNAGLKTLREALPFNPTWLSFSKIKYTVQVTNHEGQIVDKVLLDGVDGYAEPGKLTALMGASGAGKTTLLDVVAGRKSMGTIEGNIMFNGRAASPEDYANLTGYVEQFDSLFAFSTVRETLEFAAKLRLPASVPAATKEKIVDEVLEILELSSIANYLIGNEMVPGLSPSQLKRVNIGVELVANPSVLYLDEPTTGLDSKSAQIVMRVVRRIARSGRAVVCTIHQPSAELFYLFDRLLLLGSGGHQMYFGDLGSRSSRFVKYMEGISGVSKIRPRYNPASWMLEEIGVGVAALKEYVKDGPRESQAELVQRFKKTYFASRTFRRVEARLKALETLSGVEDSIEYSVSRVHNPESGEAGIERQQSYSVSVADAALPTSSTVIAKRDETSILFQFGMLLSRNFVGYWRNPPTLFPRLMVSALLSVIFGCIYFDMSIKTQTDVVSNVAALCMAINFGCFVHAGSTLPTFFGNRAVFYRERSSGMYNPGLWATVGTITELFYVIFSTFTLTIPVYFMIGAQNDVALYFKYYFASYCTIMVYISMSMFLSAVAPSAPLAQVIQGTYFGLFMTFNGIAITANNVPKGWIWLFRAFPMSHVTECLVMPQYRDDTSLLVVDGVLTTTKQYVADYLGMGYDAYWENIGWIALCILVIQILSFVFTYTLVYNNR